MCILSGTHRNKTPAINHHEFYFKYVVRLLTIIIVTRYKLISTYLIPAILHEFIRDPGLKIRVTFALSKYGLELLD